jgi:sigma54-dependent transcription regulator
VCEYKNACLKNQYRFQTGIALLHFSQLHSLNRCYLGNVSRNARATPNDSDRLRKYLARFGLSWADIAG